MRRFGIYLAILCLLLLAVWPLAAQDEEGTIARIVFFRAKPGMNAQLEDGLKKHMAWHGTQNGTWSWLVWSVDTGENTGSYGAGTFDHKWSDFDNLDVDEAADEADVVQNILPYVAEGGQWRYYRKLAKVSKSWDEMTPMEEIVVFHVEYGKEAAFMNLIKKFHEAIEKTNWPVHYDWYSLVNGGKSGEFVLVLPRKNYASMKGPEKPFPAMLEEAVGRQDADAMLKHFTKIVKYEESELIRPRPDLSYIPEGGGM